MSSANSPNLAAARGAQPLLGEQRGDQLGGVALAPQPVLQAHHLALVVGGQAPQDRPTVG